MKSTCRAATALVCAFTVALPSLALADPVKVPEGTEFPLRLEDTLSSKTTRTGDRFTVSLTDNVKLPDGTILRAGYRGVGEVAHAEKSAMLGKTGKLDLRLNYLKVGDNRIRLRGSKAAQGKHNTGAQVVTVVLVGVFAGFIKGKNTEIPRGATFNAFADQDTNLDGPIAAPPPEA
ncbi:hypothetical protein [uncultured Phenylobacterium sp.]|uniref:hypothetical protein n=1 Tax=uncultured Phenylobacterium sp. TaxID=349273 RepID=UPI0025DD7A7B|nr:hypothetical protein [uncultured Phenylobacterium sp.]